MRSLTAAALCAVACLAVLPAPASAQQKETLQGYAEWRVGDLIVVDGQRVRADARTRFTDKDWEDIELGDEMKVEGSRGRDGVVLATKVTAKENGMAMFEEDALAQADEAASQWLDDGQISDDESDDEPMEIVERGRSVTRVRTIVQRLLPPYIDPDAINVYVVKNEEWNAFAMANGTIWVHTGLIDDLNDDELAIVLGHELAHVTHEHIRLQMKKGLWYGLLQAGVEMVSSSDAAKVVAAGVALVRQNKYSRDLEDQADRVGLRYAYEAGYDPEAGPALWRRFDKKYGSEDKVTNYLFGDHSRAADRIQRLDAQLAMNYAGGIGSPTRRSRTSVDSDIRNAPKKKRSESTKDRRKRSGRVEAPKPTLAESLASLTKGMSADDVRRVLGQPGSTDTDGARLLWHYGDDFDLVFLDGKLEKVQPR